MVLPSGRTYPGAYAWPSPPDPRVPPTARCGKRRWGAAEAGPSPGLGLGGAIAPPPRPTTDRRGRTGHAAAPVKGKGHTACNGWPTRRRRRGSLSTQDDSKTDATARLMARLADPVPRAIKITASRSGGHVKVKVWIGQEPHPGLCGELTMRPEDWGDFYRMCLYGHPSFHAGYPYVIRYDSEETQTWLEGSS